MRKLFSIAVIILALCAVAQMASAQDKTATATTQITATKGETLSVAAVTTNGAFDLDGVLSSQTANVAITTTWNLKPLRATNVWVCATMPNPMAGNTGNGDSIPQSKINAKPNSGSYGSIDATISNCGLTKGVLVNTYPLSPSTQANHKNISKADTLSVQLNLTAADVTALQPDTYTGTINIVAYTN